MERDDRKPGAGGAGQQAGRAVRLAAALRDNLRRRKAQARARRGGDTADDDSRDERPDADGKSGHTG